jgi:hypothetical protein
VKSTLFLIGTLVLSSFSGYAAAPQPAPRNDAQAAFARLKTLVGEWEGNTGGGKAHVSYELVSGGTALVERESPPNMPSMLTVYYIDRDRLLLTHYCVIGNQPRLQEQSFNPETGEIIFGFLDATNLVNSNAAHMHNGKIRIVDGNHLVSEWQLYENGQPKFTETMQFTRIR